MSKRRRPTPVNIHGGRMVNYAILSPEGEFYAADAWTHEKVAKEVTGKDWDTCLENGWLRLAASAIYYAFIYREPTQAQIDAIGDYARLFQCSIVNVFDTTTRDEAAKFLGLP